MMPFIDNDIYRQEMNVGNWRTNMSAPCWCAEIYPYVKSTQVYACPSASPTDWQTPNVANGDIPTGYCAIIFQAKALAATDSPATRVWLYDHGTQIAASQAINWWVADNYPKAWPNWGTSHTEGRNNAFMDGHVKFLKESQAYANRKQLCEKDN